MVCEVKLAKIQFLSKGTIEWVGGDIHHCHVAGIDEIFRHHFNCERLLTF